MHAHIIGSVLLLARVVFSALLLHGTYTRLEDAAGSLSFRQAPEA